MNRTFLALLLFLAANFIHGQEKKCNCIDELENMSKLIVNAESYKTQIKKAEKETDFKEWKEKIKLEIINDSLSNYFCTGYLQKYISFIEDRHNEVYSILNNISANVPSYSKKIDTTQQIADKISGIYYAGSDEILIKKENDSIWFGITLKSNSEDWVKGKILLRINKSMNDKFELFEFYKNGLLYYQKDIKIENGRVHSTFWNKQNNYYFNINFKENFTFKSINPSFNYIGIKTLSRTNKLIKEADIFYKNHLGKLNKENLIIDLRNNGGGSINQAKPLLKSLTKNNDIKRIYVLINFKTASAAELLTLELKEDKRTIIVGENSRGMLEYGYGNRSFSTKTECSDFNVILSTTHMNKRLAKYEYVGIKPDLVLNNNSDWIDHIVNGNGEKK